MILLHFSNEMLMGLLYLISYRCEIIHSSWMLSFRRQTKSNQANNNPQNLNCDVLGIAYALFISYHSSEHDSDASDA